jgi:hypothetical protein
MEIIRPDWGAFNRLPKKPEKPHLSVPFRLFVTKLNETNKILCVNVLTSPAA